MVAGGGEQFLHLQAKGCSLSQCHQKRLRIPMADKQGDARLNDILDTLEQAEGEQRIADMLHGPTLPPLSFMDDAVPEPPDIGDSPPQAPISPIHNIASAPTPPPGAPSAPSQGWPVHKVARSREPTPESASELDPVEGMQPLPGVSLPGPELEGNNLVVTIPLRLRFWPRLRRLPAEVACLPQGLAPTLTLGSAHGSGQLCAPATPVMVPTVPLTTRRRMRRWRGLGCCYAVDMGEVRAEGGSRQCQDVVALHRS